MEQLQHGRAEERKGEPGERLQLRAHGEGDVQSRHGARLAELRELKRVVVVREEDDQPVLDQETALLHALLLRGLDDLGERGIKHKQIMKP